MNLDISAYIQQKKENQEKLLAVLIDPDNINTSTKLENICLNLTEGKPDLIFIGGSLMNNDNFDATTKKLASLNIAPIVIFPGNNRQISSEADGILLLSLLSGRNAEFLIGQHVTASFELQRSGIEIIPTGYLLIDCGKATAASYMSNTQPIPYSKKSIACATALAGEQLGNKLIYMDGGSGAQKPISLEMIEAVKNTINTPLIIGGGITSAEGVIKAWNHGADVVVVGTAFEKDPEFVTKINTLKKQEL